MARLPRARRPGTVSAAATPVIVPADPATLGVTLDPALVTLRSGLVAHRRRLWLRRSVRRAWYVLAGVAVAEIALAIVMRVAPVEWGPQLAAAVPIAGLLVLLVLVVRARPSIGETALAVDAEGGSGDALASALAFARPCRPPRARPARTTTRRSSSAKATSSVRPRPGSSAASAATPSAVSGPSSPGCSARASPSGRHWSRSSPACCSSRPSCSRTRRTR